VKDKKAHSDQINSIKYNIYLINFKCEISLAPAFAKLIKRDLVYLTKDRTT